MMTRKEYRESMHKSQFSNETNNEYANSASDDMIDENLNPELSYINLRTQLFNRTQNELYYQKLQTLHNQIPMDDYGSQIATKLRRNGFQRLFGNDSNYDARVQNVLSGGQRPKGWFRNDELNARSDRYNRYNLYHELGLMPDPGQYIDEKLSQYINSRNSETSFQNSDLSISNTDKYYLGQAFMETAIDGRISQDTLRHTNQLGRQMHILGLDNEDYVNRLHRNTVNAFTAKIEQEPNSPKYFTQHGRQNFDQERFRIYAPDGNHGYVSRGRVDDLAHVYDRRFGSDLFKTYSYDNPKQIKDLKASMLGGANIQDTNFGYEKPYYKSDNLYADAQIPNRKNMRKPFSALASRFDAFKDHLHNSKTDPKHEKRREKQQRRRQWAANFLNNHTNGMLSKISNSKFMQSYRQQMTNLFTFKPEYDDKTKVSTNHLVQSFNNSNLQARDFVNAHEYGTSSVSIDAIKSYLMTTDDYKQAKTTEDDIHLDQYLSVHADMVKYGYVSNQNMESLMKDPQLLNHGLIGHPLKFMRDVRNDQSFQNFEADFNENGHTNDDKYTPAKDVYKQSKLARQDYLNNYDDVFTSQSNQSLDALEKDPLQNLQKFSTSRFNHAIETFVKQHDDYVSLMGKDDYYKNGLQNSYDHNQNSDVTQVYNALAKHPISMASLVSMRNPMNLDLQNQFNRVADDTLQATFDKNNLKDSSTNEYPKQDDNQDSQLPSDTDAPQFDNEVPPYEDMDYQPEDDILPYPNDEFPQDVQASAYPNDEFPQDVQASASQNYDDYMTQLNDENVDIDNSMSSENLNDEPDADETNFNSLFDNPPEDVNANNELANKDVQPVYDNTFYEDFQKTCSDYEHTPLIRNNMALAYLSAIRADTEIPKIVGTQNQNLQNAYMHAITNQMTENDKHGFSSDEQVMIQSGADRANDINQRYQNYRNAYPHVDTLLNQNQKAYGSELQFADTKSESARPIQSINYAQVHEAYNHLSDLDLVKPLTPNTDGNLSYAQVQTEYATVLGVLPDLPGSQLKSGFNNDAVLPETFGQRSDQAHELGILNSQTLSQDVHTKFLDLQKTYQQSLVTSNTYQDVSVASQSDTTNAQSKADSIVASVKAASQLTSDSTVDINNNQQLSESVQSSMPSSESVQSSMPSSESVQSSMPSSESVQSSMPSSESVKSSIPSSESVKSSMPSSESVQSSNHSLSNTSHDMFDNLPPLPFDDFKDENPIAEDNLNDIISELNNLNVQSSTPKPISSSIADLPHSDTKSVKSDNHTSSQSSHNSSNDKSSSNNSIVVDEPETDDDEFEI